MDDASVLPLKHWESFYVIVGSSAAALTGLMFVVVTLLADSRRQRSGGALDAFATPTLNRSPWRNMALSVLDPPPLIPKIPTRLVSM